ncbi:MAG TPA: mycothiol synthase [Cellulomonas sp.]
MDLRSVSGPLSAADRDAVRALAARAADDDGVAPLDEAALLALADPAAHTLHLLAPGDPVAPVDSPDAAGELLGYAQADLGTVPPGVQLVVDPAARRRGTGRALLDAAVAAAPGGALGAWAHGDLPAARALASSAGFAPVHELWRMALDLRGRPAVDAGLRPGLVVRAFAPGHDEDAWLAVNARAFADHPDQGRWTPHDLAAREREPWFDPAGFLLAERAEGTLAGFVWTKVHPAGELAAEPVGEIYVLGVDPSAQGAGLGRALTAAGLDHLVGHGLGTAVLWVAGDNAAAIRTYRRAGFERAALDVRYARRPQVTSGSPDGATMGS